MEHCENPEKCPTNIERERDMQTMKQDYSKTQKALKETDGKLGKVSTDLAITNNNVKNLVTEMRRDREDNCREHEALKKEQGVLHHRITTAKIGAVESDAEIKVAQASKLSTGDLVKIFVIFTSLITIYGFISKYIIPEGG